MINAVVFGIVLSQQNALENSLMRSPGTVEFWRSILKEVSQEQKAGAEFLIINMPEADLKSFSKSMFTQNLALAYQARNATAWAKAIPQDVFFNDVLPYSAATEPRNSMRQEFFTKYLPLVKNAKTSGEAALLINAKLFPDYKVTYNTRRLRTDQNSRETIGQGMATCTGLSIMLVEACRAVGVPARVAGIHSWPGRGGNHTWVEVWDNGKWHYVGAAEPDDKGLNHAWFGGDAAKAIESIPENAVYAISYKPTGDYFPLAWDPGTKINAVNVTKSYKTAEVASGPRIMVEVKDNGTRVQVPVTVLDSETGEVVLEGTSFGPTADMNFHLNQQVRKGQKLLISVKAQSETFNQMVEVGDDFVAKFDLKNPSHLSEEQLDSILWRMFAAQKETVSAATRLLQHVEVTDAAKNSAWQNYLKSPQHESLQGDFEGNVVKTATRTAPYKWRQVGTKPKDGWGLVIAMHGGGGVAKQFNDEQWEGMFRSYYKDHPEVGGYIYLALRAPNDEWNGFYDDEISPMVEQLIKQFTLYGDVNPDRVVATGASHGGYGAFVIAPKIPFRFHAANASASAPTPGETRGINLMNTYFSWTIGEQDTAYGRADRCKEFDQQVATWKAAHGHFRGGMIWLPGVGHSVPDRDIVKDLFEKGGRDLRAKHLIWEMSDTKIKRFFWLEAMNPTENATIDATQKTPGNFEITTKGYSGTLALWLDESQLAGSEVNVILNGTEQKVPVSPNMLTYVQGLSATADPGLSGSVRVVLEIK